MTAEAQVDEGDLEPITEEALEQEEVAGTDGSEEETVVTIGEAPPDGEEQEQANAPEWVRETRKANREHKKRILELEEQLRATKAVYKPSGLGAKPTLEEHDYVAEAYEAALSSWFEQKRTVDEQAVKARVEAEAQEQAWKAKLESYGTAKTQLKVKDFEDAEIVAQELLSTTQQGIILQGSENPALVVYALGKNPARAKELAAITDPVKYAFAVSKLEAQLKVTQRKAPSPERTVSGTGSMSGTVGGTTLERLRAEAEKTGDYTKVVQYRKQLKAKQA